MMQEAAVLEIKIHLIDKQVINFVVADVPESRRILELINPGKFFEPKQLVIACEEGVTAVQLNRVIRVELLSPEIPAWPFHHNIRSVTEISEETFLDIYVNRKHINQPFGDTIFAIARMELTNGEKIYLHMEINSDPAISPLTPLDNHVFIQQLFASNGLHVRLKDRGMLIVNPAHISVLTTHPGPGLIPTGAWHAKQSIK